MSSLPPARRAPDYADRIARRLASDIDEMPSDWVVLRDLLARAAREGYALGLGVNS